MKIIAEWDEEFGKREPGTDAIFLVAGETCLGYISRDGKSLMACVGAGMGAAIVAAGVITLDEAKRAVERHYGIVPQKSEPPKPWWYEQLWHDTGGSHGNY